MHRLICSSRSVVLRGGGGPPVATSIFCGRHFATAATASSPSVMQAEGYKKHSHGQYDVHNLSRDMLLASAMRVVPATVGGSMRIVDLGAADGTNSMNTIKFLANSIVSNSESSKSPSSFHLTFEEHPATDETVLRGVLGSHDEWFQQHSIDYDVLMKSFYEPLFEKSSIDMLVSYICLHWLDTTDAPDAGAVSSWKKVVGNSNTDFIFVQEDGVAEGVKEHWKNKLAKPHLIKFLQLRTKELKVGGEMVLVMVGAPFAWYTVKGGSLLTHAVRKCVDQGAVRSEILENSVIPYYLRSLDDIENALSVCNQQLDGESIKLKVMDKREIRLDLGKGSESDMDNAFNMLWAVHQGALRASGATDDEMKAIKDEAVMLNSEIFDPADGIETAYLACVLKRIV
jgi:hypothetical protein